MSESNVLDLHSAPSSAAGFDFQFQRALKKIEYIPKFTVSGKAMRLIMEIAAALERYKIVMEGPDGVRLRKLNHVRTIRGTTAIEGNTLTEDQITAVLAGKRVVATRRAN